MRHIEDKTRINGKDCIKFVPRGNEGTYLNITSLTGCYCKLSLFSKLQLIPSLIYLFNNSHSIFNKKAYVGRSSLVSGAQVLSLQRPAAPGAGHCLHKGTAAHEMIHALGYNFHFIFFFSIFSSFSHILLF